MIVKISLAFARLSDSVLVTKGDQILACMTGNPAYTTPAPTLAAVQTLVTAFQDALATAADGGRTKTAAKNAAREALLSKLRLLALYVQGQCNNDLATLLSSGFDPIKARTPAGVLEAPQNVTLTQASLSGQLVMRADPVENGASYVSQRTTMVNDRNSWENCGFTTAARATLENLSPGTLYWGRMRAIGAAGPGAWSEPVSAMAI